MAVSEEALDHLEQQIPQLSAAAVKVGYWRALAAGQRVLVSDDDGIYEVFADGGRKLVRRLNAQLSVPIGTRVRIPQRMSVPRLRMLRRTERFREEHDQGSRA